LGGRNESSVRGSEPQGKADEPAETQHPSKAGSLPAGLSGLHFAQTDF